MRERGARCGVRPKCSLRANHQRAEARSTGDQWGFGRKSFAYRERSAAIIHEREPEAGDATIGVAGTRASASCTAGPCAPS
jgi:hypothetical protein